MTLTRSLTALYICTPLTNRCTRSTFSSNRWRRANSSSLSSLRDFTEDGAAPGGSNAVMMGFGSTVVYFLKRHRSNFPGTTARLLPPRSYVSAVPGLTKLHWRTGLMIRIAAIG